MHRRASMPHVVVKAGMTARRRRKPDRVVTMSLLCRRTDAPNFARQTGSWNRLSG
jgi:hypothetical protein